MPPKGLRVDLREGNWCCPLDIHARLNVVQFFMLEMRSNVSLETRGMALSIPASLRAANTDKAE